MVMNFDELLHQTNVQWGMGVDLGKDWGKEKTEKMTKR